MVGQVRVPKEETIQGRGVVIFNICGCKTNYLAFNKNFKQCTLCTKPPLPLKFCIQKNEILPPLLPPLFLLGYAHLPHHVEQFYTIRKDEYT